MKRGQSPPPCGRSPFEKGAFLCGLVSTPFKQGNSATGALQSPLFKGGGICEANDGGLAYSTTARISFWRTMVYSPPPLPAKLRFAGAPWGFHLRLPEMNSVSLRRLRAAPSPGGAQVDGSRHLLPGVTPQRPGYRSGGRWCIPRRRSPQNSVSRGPLGDFICGCRK